MFEEYVLHLLILICLNIILVLSLQLSIGFTGLLNLGHAGFFAVGAYTSALLHIYGTGFIASLIAGAMLSALFGVILALSTNRLKGDYFALATLGFSFLVYTTIQNWKGVTGGALGISRIPAPNLFGIKFDSNMEFFILTLVFAIISYTVIKRITVSPFGRLLEAIRDDELAVSFLGKNTLRMKIYSLAITAFFAGISGSLYAHYITFIDPSSFNFFQLIQWITIVIIGGLASLEGAVLGSFLIIIIPEPLRFIGFPSTIIGPIRQFLFAFFLLIIIYYLPKGFFGKIELK